MGGKLIEIDFKKICLSKWFILFSAEVLAWFSVWLDLKILSGFFIIPFNMILVYLLFVPIIPTIGFVQIINLIKTKAKTMNYLLILILIVIDALWSFLYFYLFCLLDG